MKKWVIIETEAHPDRGIDAIIGPFDTYEEAHQSAAEFEAHPHNFFNQGKGSKRSYFRAYEMDLPGEYL